MNKKIFKLLVLPSVPNMEQAVAKSPFPILLTKGQFKNIEIIFKDGQTTILHNGTDMREFSLVWLCSSWRSRSIAYAIQLYLNKHKIPNTQVEKGTSKLTDHMIFSLHGFPNPDTLFMGSRKIATNLERIKNVCGYPLIIKDINGSRGTHSAKVSSEEELLQEMKNLPAHKRYIFQRYIVNEYDWGIMVANGVVVAGEKSYPCSGEFRNNTCNGATEIFVDINEIPNDIKKLAIDVSNALGLKWSRTDIIIDAHTKKPFVLEINRLPGLTTETAEIEGAHIFLSSQIKLLTKVPSYQI